jgi:hypothetical protein
VKQQKKNCNKFNQASKIIMHVHDFFFQFFNCNIHGDHLGIPPSTSNKIELKLNLHLGMG